MKKKIEIRYAHPVAGEKNSIGERVRAYGSPETEHVRDYPVRDAAQAQAYGLKPDRARRLFTDGPTDIRPEDGVWMPGDTGDQPPWNVRDVMDWPRHAEIIVERVIPRDAG